MIITQVTFDGIDENITPTQLCHLHDEFKGQIRFGIKVGTHTITPQGRSKSHSHHPSQKWIQEVCKRFKAEHRHGLILHLTGTPMREFIRGHFPHHELYADFLDVNSFDCILPD